jgi:hypothetical protein
MDACGVRCTLGPKISEPGLTAPHAATPAQAPTAEEIKMGHGFMNAHFPMRIAAGPE